VEGALCGILLLIQGYPIFIVEIYILNEIISLNGKIKGK
jgi:hypothetical protein